MGGFLAVLNIIEWPAKVLETKTNVVTQFDKELKNFVADMFETMHASKGIGLAANQVGDLRLVLVIHIPFSGHRYENAEAKKEQNENQIEDQNEDQDEDRVVEERQWWHDKSMTFVNPTIIKKAGKINFQEGCLSFPDVFDFVDRSAEVWVKAQDESGQWFEVHATGIFAVCLQHEIDHLDGIVFINRMSRLKSSMIRKKLQKSENIQKISQEIKIEKKELANAR